MRPACRAASNLRDYGTKDRHCLSQGVKKAAARQADKQSGTDDAGMKITKLTTFVVPPRWLFLKIETDEGITGWGEPVVEGRAETVAACVAELADYLVGKDPAPIEDHWTVLYRGGFYRGGAHPYERAGRHRPGAVGHQGQGAGPARACSAGRARAPEDAGL